MIAIKYGGGDEPDFHVIEPITIDGALPGTKHTAYKVKVSARAFFYLRRDATTRATSKYRGGTITSSCCAP